MALSGIRKYSTAAIVRDSIKIIYIGEVIEFVREVKIHE
jgi:hypothetical protein